MNFRKAVMLFLFVIAGYAKGWAQWNRVQTGIEHNLFSISHAGLGIVYTCGAKGSILRSLDSGATWQNRSLVGLENLRKIHFINPQLGFVCGENAVLYVTQDSGKIWSQRYSLINKYLNTVSFSNGSLVAAGREGFLITSKDTGTSWSQISTFTTRFFYSSAALHDGRFLIGSDSGYLYVLNASLDTLQVEKLQTNLRITQIQVLSTGEVIVSGGNADTVGNAIHQNFLLISEDTLKNWSIYHFDEKRQFNASHFVNRFVGYFSQPSGIIANTFDGGLSFGEHYIGTPLNLSDVYFFDDARGIIVGDIGRIYSTENSGGWGLQTSFPHDLEQVKIFPNPACQKLQIHSNQKANFSIINVEGKKVLSIENIEGVHEVELQNMRSGIYFYNFTYHNPTIPTRSGRLIVQN
jgi:photosystem II stability/assembly factor-like uncharacterized protein